MPSLPTPIFLHPLIVTWKMVYLLLMFVIEIKRTVSNSKSWINTREGGFSVMFFVIWAKLALLCVCMQRERLTSLSSLFSVAATGEEFGMLEDMEVGISDLQRVMFKITEAKSDDLSDLQPLVCGQRWDLVIFFVFLLKSNYRKEIGPNTYLRHMWSPLMVSNIPLRS